MALACDLVRDEVLTPQTLVEKICLNPAKIAGVYADYERIGGVVVVDPAKTWQVTSEAMYSQGKNTPFIGQTLKGRVVETVFD